MIDPYFYKRKNLKIGTLYFEVKSQQYFETPDCIGVYWYDYTQAKEVGWTDLAMFNARHIERLED
jgi:hypothetical protein